MNTVGQVLSALDARKQTAMDGQRSLQAVFRRLNGEDIETSSSKESATASRDGDESASSVTFSDPAKQVSPRAKSGSQSREIDQFQEICESVAETDLDEFFDSYIRDIGVPEVPNHTDLPATMGYDDPDGMLTIESHECGTDTEDSKVTVSLSVEGVDVESAKAGVRPKRGYIDILVDEPTVSPGQEMPAGDGVFRLNNGSQAATVEVRAEAKSLRVQLSDAAGIAYALSDGITINRKIDDYANENDVVDTEGLRDAIDDWRAGDIDTELLREVIDAWRSGEPVE